MSIAAINPDRIRAYVARHPRLATPPTLSDLSSPASPAIRPQVPDDGLTQSQRVIKHVQAHGPVGYADVAAALSIKPNAAMMLLKRLARSGALRVTREGRTGPAGWPTLFGVA